MGAWSSRGLRGSDFEHMINLSNEIYREKGLALIQKVPTPITPINFDKESRHITLAYFEQKSTVDYIGVVQGVPVCFDAKECSADAFPLANIHEHQIEFMKDFEKQDGISFFLLYFTKYGRFYYLTMEELQRFIDRKDNGGLKRFRYTELEERYFLSAGKGVIVPYLDGIKLDLESRD